MLRAVMLFFAILCLATGASAQQRVTVEVWVFHIETMKVLPAGHHHFVAVPDGIRAQKMWSEDHVLCESFEGAISLGKRLWQGMSPHESAREIALAHGGRAVCGSLSRSVLLTPLEVAIRSHDGVHRVHVLKLQDEHGRIHFTSQPVRPAS